LIDICYWLIERISEEIIMVKWPQRTNCRICILSFILVWLVACSAGSNISENYHDPEMDFSLLRTVAVMPFDNLTTDRLAAARVRNTFMTSLFATGVVYVIPSGEVVRGIKRAGIENPVIPSPDEIAKLAAIIKADAVITGVVNEYGQVRSAATTANVISVSMQMIEKESRKVVWSASTTKGGISVWDRLFGGGGRPMEDVTEAAINDLIKKLFY
jgi:hypothetical protein